MPILENNFVVLAAGADGLGGALSSVVSGALNTLFGAVTKGDQENGVVEYRCVYLKNSHPNLLLNDAEAWVDSNTPSEKTHVRIGVGSAPVGEIEQVVASGTTPPVGVSFLDAPSEYSSVPLGDIPSGSHKSLWIERTVQPGAPALAFDGVRITFRGGTVQ